jgi:hypothetical protein
MALVWGSAARHDCHFVGRQFPAKCPCAPALVEECLAFSGRHMNKSVLALAGFGFAAGIVLLLSLSRF